MARDKGVEGEVEGFPHPTKMPREAYESELEDLQIELVKMQQWVKNSGNA